MQQLCFFYINTLFHIVNIIYYIYDITLKKYM